MSEMGRPVTITITREDVGLREKLESLPSSPGVYQHKDAAGKVLYVGKAKNLRARVRQYFQKTRTLDPRIERMLSRATDLEIIVTASEVEALILESNLIKKLKPRYNVTLKDDKSYPYIVITNEPFPRVFVTRRVIRDGSRYFGPYTDVKNVRAALKAVRDLFMIRSCNYAIDEEFIRKKKVRVCLDYHIRKCEGPCEGLVARATYGAMINQVASVLEGKTDTLVERLEGEMAHLAENMRFEDAAVLRDRIRGLRAYSERQTAVDLHRTDRDIAAFAASDDDACGVIFRIRDGKLMGRQHYYMAGVEGRPDTEIVAAMLQQYYLDAEFIPEAVLVPVLPGDAVTVQDWLTARRGSHVGISLPGTEEEQTLIRLSQSNARFLLEELRIQRMKRADAIPAAIAALQKHLRLDRPPRRMECFDISNIQGSDAVASMVVFVDGKPKKSEYRKFRIRTVEGPDDFASMKEVVERRYRRLQQEGAAMPDLIVIDGGKGQLSRALEVLRSLDLPGQAVIGLAKRLEEVYLPGRGEPETIPKSSSGLRLLQQIRDEAHRFAVSYHRTLRARRTLQTELDLISGVGKTRARELLEAFGSVQGVRFATPAQLAEIVGEKVAQKIRQFFDLPEDQDSPP